MEHVTICRFEDVCRLLQNHLVFSTLLGKTNSMRLRSKQGFPAPSKLYINVAFTLTGAIFVIGRCASCSTFKHKTSLGSIFFHNTQQEIRGTLH